MTDNNINIRTAILKNDVFDKCKIVARNKKYYFLEDLDKNTYYDIVMPKENCGNKTYKLNDMISVQVDGINIAPDGVPGVFVRPKVA